MYLKIIILAFCASTVLAYTQKSIKSTIRGCVQMYSYYQILVESGPVENCILACSMKKLRTMSPEGKYHVEDVIKLLRKDISAYDEIVSVLRTCANKSGETHCDTAGSIRECLRKNLPCRNEKECSITSDLLMINPRMV